MIQWVVVVRHRQTPELSRQGLISKVDPDGDMKWYLRRDGQWGNASSPKKYIQTFRSKKVAQREAFGFSLKYPTVIGAIFVEEFK